MFGKRNKNYDQPVLKHTPRPANRHESYHFVSTEKRAPTPRLKLDQHKNSAGPSMTSSLPTSVKDLLHVLQQPTAFQLTTYCGQTDLSSLNSLVTGQASKDTYNPETVIHRRDSNTN